MTDKILIDWSDSGQFDHEFADVTAYYREYLVRFGMDTQSNRHNFQNVTAQGSITLDNKRKFFSPESLLGIEREALNSRHLCRIVSSLDGYGDETLWEGHAEPVRNERRQGGLVAYLDLVGKLDGPYREEIIVRSGGERDVEWWLDGMFEALGAAPRTNTVNMSTGRVIWPDESEPGEPRRGYKPTRHDFIEALSDFAGAFAFEDHIGCLQFHDYILMDDLPLTVTIDTDNHKLLSEETRTFRHFGLVRNAVQVESYEENRRILNERFSFGETPDKPQRCPAWFTPSSAVDALTWLAYRSGDIQFAQLCFLRDQDTAELDIDVESVRPGVLFEANLLDVDNLPISGQFFCLGAKLVSYFNSPRLLYAYCIATELSDPAGFVLGRSRLGVGELGDGTQ